MKEMQCRCPARECEPKDETRKYSADVVMFLARDTRHSGDTLQEVVHGVVAWHVMTVCIDFFSTAHTL